VVVQEQAQVEPQATQQVATAAHLLEQAQTQPLQTSVAVAVAVVETTTRQARGPTVWSM
jgi:hypothetical protein